MLSCWIPPQTNIQILLPVSCCWEFNPLFTAVSEDSPPNPQEINPSPVCPLQIDISKCHYLVDLDTAAESPREPRYSSNREEWVTIAYKPFLDASR